MQKITAPALVLALLFGAPAFAAVQSAAPAASAHYPLTTCVVSGDTLGEDGPIVHYTYKQAGKPDREIQFCCKDCIADFEKDPAKYVAKLDAAASGAAPTAMAMPEHHAKGMTMASCSNCKAGEGSANGCELLQSYTPIATALAADDLPKAKSAATDLLKAASADGMTPIAQSAHAIVTAKDISAAREAFKSLSQEIVPMAKGAKGYVVLTCPMAKADWVQTDANVRNPYLGKAMPSCGTVKE